MKSWIELLILIIGVKIIDSASYRLAFLVVGYLYDSGRINTRDDGSGLHWIFRLLFWFVGLVLLGAILQIFVMLKKG